MLGRLHMTIEDVEGKYGELAEIVFKDNGGWDMDNLSSYLSGARYDAELFEECIQGILEDEVRDKNALLYEKDGKCKVCVMSPRP